jgi:hypothetical protein
MQEHRYDEAMRAIDKMLGPARGNNAAVDRQEMLLARAECQVQLKRRDDAIRTLNQVRQEADRDNDIKASSEAFAFVTLIQRSTNFQYKPGTSNDKTPLNILDPDARKSAYNALLADELAAINKQQTSARTDQHLVPIVQIAEAFYRVQAIERTATGNTSQTDLLAKELSQWAGGRFDATLLGYSDQINKIAESANQPSVPGTIVGDPGTKVKVPRSAPRGLSPADIQALNTIVSDCQKIPTATANFSRAFGESDLSDRNAVAQGVATRANNCLQGDYEGAKGSVPKPSSSKSSSRRGSQAK